MIGKDIQIKKKDLMMKKEGFRSDKIAIELPNIFIKEIEKK